MSTPLRVAVISRHGLTRAGLVHLIALDPARARVVSVEKTYGEPCEVDVVMYDLTGRIDDQEWRKLASAPTPVVALTSDASPNFTGRVLAAGVARVVAMEVSASSLLENLEIAARECQLSVGRSRARALARHEAQVLAGLTGREVEVLDLVAAGKTNEQIALALYLSVNTVKTYIRTAYKRIGAHSRPQAMVWAICHNLGPFAEMNIAPPGLSPADPPRDIHVFGEIAG